MKPRWWSNQLLRNITQIILCICINYNERGLLLKKTTQAGSRVLRKFLPRNYSCFFNNNPSESLLIKIFKKDRIT